MCYVLGYVEIKIANTRDRRVTELKLQMASSWTAVQVAVGTRVEARVDVEFGSQDAEDTFLNVINGSGIKKGRLVIVSIEKDGQFKGKMIKA